VPPSSTGERFRPFGSGRDRDQFPAVSRCANSGVLAGDSAGPSGPLLTIRSQ